MSAMTMGMERCWRERSPASSPTSRAAASSASVGLLAVKFIDVRIPANVEQCRKSHQYAVDAGAKIISASWDVGLNGPELERNKACRE